MSGITAEGLKRAQDKWAKIELDFASAHSRNWSNLHDLRHSLEEMGLDLAQDETYDLLESGLTKKRFDETFTHAVINETLQHYHRVVTPNREDYQNTYSGRRAYGLDHLREHMLPALEENIAKTGIPETVPPLVRRELDLLLAVHRDGTLEDDMRRAAARAAQDSFRSARAWAETVAQQKPGDRNIRPTQEGLSYADSALSQIEQAGAYYKPEDIYAKYSSFGGWDKEAGTVPFSREAVEGLRRSFLTRELAMKFSLASKFQDQGHFVLDASGSGHGMMVMPMQDIAEKLAEYGYDIHDPDTFTAIDTDMDTFRDRYRRERAAVLGNDQYKLMKPEIGF